MAYQKQTWEDLPSTNTPITATRLNHIEDGIEGVETGLTPVTSYTQTDNKGYSCNYINNLQKIIYENSSGDDTDIICTENPNNFDYLQFDFLHQDYHTSSIVPLIDDKIEISSIGIPSGNTILQLINQRYTINGSTLEFDVCGMVNISNRSIQYQDFENVPTLHIKKVTGIKRN